MCAGVCNQFLLNLGSYVVVQNFIDRARTKIEAMSPTFITKINTLGDIYIKLTFKILKHYS